MNKIRYFFRCNILSFNYNRQLKAELKYKLINLTPNGYISLAKIF